MSSKSQHALKTRVILSSSLECKKNIRAFLKDLSERINDLELGKVTIAHKGRPIPLYGSDVYRAVIDLECKNKESLILRNILVDALKKCRKIAPGHEIILANIFVCLLNSMVSHIGERYYKDDPGTLDDILKNLSYRTKEATLKELHDVVRACINDATSSELVIQSATMAGSSGQVYVEKTHSNKTCIELTTGYNFSFAPAPEFSVMTNLTRWKRREAKAVVIDGVIERISEIDGILQKASRDLQPIALFCRGYSEEVIATLATNFSNNRLDVVPVIVSFDAYGANALNDIAVVSGIDIISSLKGDLISKINIEDYPCADEIIVGKRQTIIINQNTQDSVRMHSFNISKERDNLDQAAAVGSTDKADILNRRLSSLNSRCSHIKFGEDIGSYSGIYIERASTGIQLFRDVYVHGRISSSDIIDVCKAIDENSMIKRSIVKVIEKMVSNNITMLGAKGLIESIRLGVSCAESASSVKAYIVND